MNDIKKVLITGETGFVGTNLTSYLNNFGYTTKGVTRTPKSTKECSYHSLSEQHWNAAFACIHLAGKAHDLKGVSNEAAYFEVNRDLTKNLFDQFLESECEVFIYMSSVKAVADSVDGILSEVEVPNPKTAYGKSKLAAEAYIQSKTLPKGKYVYILRPCMIHGPGNKGNLNLLFQLVNKGIPYPLGAFKNKRSFLSVENLCFSIVELLKQQPNSAIFNLADDEAIPTTQLITIIAETLHKKPKIVAVPKKLIYIFAKLNTLLKLPFSEEKLQKLTESFVVDASKIKKTLNIQFPIPTQEGLIKTIKSFQQ